MLINLTLNQSATILADLWHSYDPEVRIAVKAETPNKHQQFESSDVDGTASGRLLHLDCKTNIFQATTACPRRLLVC